jgi:large subunit ribosomal protein L16
MEINKYKKHHKIKNSLKNEKSTLAHISKGFYGLKTVTTGTLTIKQLETVRRTIARITKRSGKIIINIFFKQPLTKKPLLSRMGKGSGGISTWISYIKKGKIIIELKGVTEKISFLALKAVKNQINIKMKIIKREIFDV